MSNDIFYFQDSEIPASIPEIRNETFVLLRAGIKHGQIVIISHRDSACRFTNRAILPEVLFRYNGNWYLAAFCYLRKDKRIFRVDRIDEAELTERKDQSHGIAEDIRKNGVSWLAKTSQTAVKHSDSLMEEEGLWVKLEVARGKDGAEFYVSSSSQDGNYTKTSKDFSYDLIRHSQFGDIERMREDIAAGAEIDFWAERGTTAMTSAARNGRLAAVKFLVENGGSAHFADGCNSTPLITASRSGNMDLVRYLVEELHSDINHRDRLGWSPLFCAVLDNHPDLVHYYLGKGANINILDKEKQSTLMLCFRLSFASKGEALLLAQILVQGGIELDAQDKQGRTALFYAIEKGNDQAIEFLLNSGASAKICDKKGNSVLLYALQRYNCMHAFRSLQIRICDADESAKLFKVVQGLISRGADVNLANNEGITPLMLAKGEVLPCLLQNGADVTAVTKDGTTVAMHHHDSLRSLQLLKEYGADITASNRWGDNVILLANPNYRFVRQLIETYGFSTNAKNNRNETILHRACENCDLQLVQYLMKHGANQNVKDAQGKTPYEYLDEKSYFGSAYGDDYEIMDHLEECQEHETENLFNACREFDLPGIKRSVEYGAIVKRIKGGRITVMTVVAAQFERCKDVSSCIFSEVVGFLREAGADINDVDMNGTCVLLALIRRHEAELIREFLADGADPNIRSHSGEFNSLLKEVSIEQEMFMHEHNGRTSPQLTTILEVLKAYGAECLT